MDGENNYPIDRRASLTLHWMEAQPIVFAFIHNMVRDRHQAEDVLQEVALAIASDYDNYDSGRPFTPWALGIARFRVLRHFSKSSDRNLVFNEQLVHQFADAYQEKASELGDRRDALEACLGKLDGRARSVIELRYVRDLEVAEISRQLGATPHAISNLLYRARVALGKCVNRRLRRSESI